uniref:F-box domain, leucine-rich repeat domain, L domain-like protein n=1 Tax=Tanacetum cinerariifolium TaxID=118510 RepID=A0A6L2KKK4_TANCI|nr:F-box domain, leucine-rich repeat domain, L domain-like protein [Tanacetum cinerariifolium]
MWRRSGGHVPRALRQKSGISIFSFGMIPETLPEPLKINKTRQRARSYLNRDPGRLPAFEMRWQSSGTQEYPSLIDTFFMAHTVNGVFTRDEDRLIYEEIRRLEDTGTYTNDEINSLARRGKQRGHIPGVGRVLPVRVTAVPSRPAPESTLKSLHKKVDFMMRLFKSDSSSTLIRFHSLSRLVPAGVAGAAGVGMTRRVPTIRRTRMRMAMAIVSCVIYIVGKLIGGYNLRLRNVGLMNQSLVNRSLISWCLISWRWVLILVRSLEELVSPLVVPLRIMVSLIPVLVMEVLILIVTVLILVETWWS